jgi:hypothetical protein
MVVPPGTHLDDGLGDLDDARAGPRAVEDRATAPDAVGIIHLDLARHGILAADLDLAHPAVGDHRERGVPAYAVHDDSDMAPGNGLFSGISPGPSGGRTATRSFYHKSVTISLLG